MKSVHLFFLVTLMSVLFINPLLSQAKASDKNIAAPSVTNAIPEDLKIIFKKSCLDCHATGGNRMAMMKLNFSSWDSYKSDKQISKAAAICKEVTKGSMPPKSYIKSHPDAVITDAQKEQICKWSHTLAPIK